MDDGLHSCPPQRAAPNCVARIIEPKRNTMTLHKTIRRVALLAALLSAAAGSARADAVIDWNDHANAAAVAACIVPSENPLHESRMYAMVHLAIHDALNAIQRRSRPYAYNAKVRANTSA